MKPIVSGLDIDLRAQFDELLKDYGHYIILAHTSSNLCSCARGQGQQATAKCPFCLGIGRVIKLQKVKAIDEVASQVVTLPHLTQQTNVGDISGNAKAFYFRHDVNPSVEDVIYEIAWDKDGNVGKLIASYFVGYAQPMRMDNGRTEYWITANVRQVDNMQWKEQTLKRLPMRRG